MRWRAIIMPGRQTRMTTRNDAAAERRRQPNAGRGLQPADQEPAAKRVTCAKREVVPLIVRHSGHMPVCLIMKAATRQQLTPSRTTTRALLVSIDDFRIIKSVNVRPSCQLPNDLGYRDERANSSANGVICWLEGSGSTRQAGGARINSLTGSSGWTRVKAPCP